MIIHHRRLIVYSTNRGSIPGFYNLIAAAAAVPKLSPSPALAQAPGMLSAALQGQLPSHAHQPGPPTPPRTPQVSQPVQTPSYMSALILLQIQGNKFEESRGGGAQGAVPKMPSLFHAMGLQHQLQQLPKPPPLAAVGQQLQHGKQGLQGQHIHAYLSSCPPHASFNLSKSAKEHF